MIFTMKNTRLGMIETIAEVTTPMSFVKRFISSPEWYAEISPYSFIIIAWKRSFFILMSNFALMTKT